MCEQKLELSHGFWVKSHWGSESSLTLGKALLGLCPEFPIYLLEMLDYVTFECLVRMMSVWLCEHFIIIPGTLFYILRAGWYCIFVHLVPTSMPKRMLYQTSTENNGSN